MSNNKIRQHIQEMFDHKGEKREPTIYSSLNMKQRIAKHFQSDYHSYIVDFDVLSKKVEKEQFLSLPFEHVTIYVPPMPGFDGLFLTLREQIDQEQILVSFQSGNVLLDFIVMMDAREGVQTWVSLDNAFLGKNGEKWTKLSEIASVVDLEAGQIEEFVQMIEREYHNAIKVVSQFFGLLQSKELVYGKSSFKVRAKVDKKVVKVKDFTHISTKKYQSQTEANFSHPITWSHGFWVSGHWRKKEKGLGKDRQGNYVIKGKTWVMPHTRKDELGIVKKTRIID